MSRANPLLALERKWEHDIQLLQEIADYFGPDNQYKQYCEAAQYILQRCIRELRVARHGQGNAQPEGE